MRSTRSWIAVATVCGAVVAGTTACTAPATQESSSPGAAAPLEKVSLVEKAAFPLPAHLESADIAAGEVGFPQLMAAGRDLFHTLYNGFDGVGVQELPGGVKVHRFAMVPPGGTLLAPAAQSCGSCHGMPYPASAGASHTHVADDPDQDGQGPFNFRSTTSLFGDGILQRLAEEMTEELQVARDEVTAAAKETPGTPVHRELSAKGVAFGRLSAVAGNDGEVTVDVSEVQGVDPDLVVRPIGWKGQITSVRTIVFGAATVGLGMQPEEFVWRVPGGDDHPDLDGDGVERELSVGDITAMTVYTAGQETPQELGYLAEHGYVAPPTESEQGLIERGRAAFADVGCATCHVPELQLEDTVFEEPTGRGNGHYYDHFLAGRDPGYDPAKPVRFDLLTDAQEPRAQASPDGGAAIRLYGDLKRHAMGRHLAEPAVDSPALTPEFTPVMRDGQPALIPSDVFLTTELWGVGNTGPWLHDGRAATLREAVLLHGEDDPPAVGKAGRGEAQESRDAFVALPREDQDALVAFLLSLRTFSPSTAP